jgi:arylsulfatase A-like enzyme
VTTRRDVARAAAAIAAAFALACAATGCSSCGKSGGEEVPVPTKTAPSASTAPANGSKASSDLRAAIDPVGRLEDCLLGHKGTLLDLGDPSMRARFGGSAARADMEIVEREGATWTRFRGSTVSMTFPATSAEVGQTDPTWIEARVRGISARSMSVYMNGKPIGAAALVKGEDKLVIAHATSNLVVEGTNEVTLHFNGGTRGSTEPFAEIDWIHIGSGEPDPSYAAPTRADVTTNTTLGGVAKQAISLRAPGFLRCNGWLPEGGTVDLSIGVAGAGDAEVEVRRLVDRANPLIIKRIHVAPGSTWTHETMPLGDVGKGGTVGALEIAAVRASKGTRVLIGEPRVLASPTPAYVPPAPSRGVVLVVMGELAPRSVAIHGGPLVLPELGAIAADGIVFDAHRASTTLPNGALASILSGRTARANNVDDGDARLPKGVTTIADLARQAGIVTGFFTANPMTGPKYGFDRSWETSVYHPPTEPGPATRVFDDAAKWIEAHKSERFLVVIHARGGHPPWDITDEELKTLAPANYAGGLDPKHAAELLSKARHVPPQIRFNDADRARAAALYEHALLAHDVAFGKFWATVRAAKRDVDTTLIVTSDLSVDDTAHVPYGDGDAPDEGSLWTSLVLRTGAKTGAGTRVAHPTADVDVARTVTTALGLEPSAYFQGIDLFRTASGWTPPEGRALLATARTRFALRWGSFVLSGNERHEQLCDLTLEPTCLTDVRSTHPLAFDALDRVYFDMKKTEAGGKPRETVEVDAETSASLKAWGR